MLDKIEKLSKVLNESYSEKTLRASLGTFFAKNLGINKFSINIEGKDTLEQHYNFKFPMFKHKKCIGFLEFNEESDASVINNYANDNEKLKKTIQNLNNQCNEYELKLELSEKQLKEQKDEYENKIISLEKDNLKLSEDSKLFNECNKKLSNAEAAYEELRKKYKDSDIARNEAELKASNLQSEYEKIFDKQDKEIKDLNTQLKELKQKYENKCNRFKTI